VSSVVYVLLSRFWPAKAVPEKWKEDGDQDVLEGRTTHSPNSEEDSGQLKLDEEADYDGHAFGSVSSPKSF
jgi:hypothetical protein